MSKVETQNAEMDGRVKALNRAAADFEWQTVRELATQLLKQDDLAPEAIVQLLRHRANSHEYRDKCRKELKT